MILWFVNPSLSFAACCFPAGSKGKLLRASVLPSLQVLDDAGFDGLASSGAHPSIPAGIHPTSPNDRGVSYCPRMSIAFHVRRHPALKLIRSCEVRYTYHCPSSI
ncbi:hypothetical protein FB451DRAFT_1388090 [Mycena latifolia]|nr:hypothetical protein FB451DRAFT_1388090 [Mycena latifolia]